MNKKRNIVLDFSRIYQATDIQKGDFDYIDCSDIGGTDMYCSTEAENILATYLSRVVYISFT
ncbi:MAG: hypothetical protein U0K57_04665 [Lachnospiraceae bacterium]|nr:hypothetical protein [Lachnospiraceae bacterium]